jgi:hypothetical protein
MQVYTPEYIEQKPVLFRKDLVQRLLKDEQEKASGTGVMH